MCSDNLTVGHVGHFVDTFTIEREQQRSAARQSDDKLRVQIVKNGASSIDGQHRLVVANERLGCMSQAASVTQRVEGV